MNTYITFQVQEQRYADFVTQMRAKGYHTSWVDSGQSYKMPKNCMWKPNISLQQGLADAQYVASILNTTLERCIVLNGFPYSGILGV